EFSGMIAVAIEFIREFGQIVRLRASRWKHPERAPQPVRDQRKPHHGAQQRLGPGKERLIYGAELRKDEWSLVNHPVRGAVSSTRGTGQGIVWDQLSTLEGLRFGS